MTTSRGQTPPANLKERIAALQQRGASPNTHQSAQATPRGLPSPGSGGLRDRIAKFEEKGGTPVPRGSIGMGAPQLAENAPPKKRGELYGNRVPGLGKPSGVPVDSRSSSPLPPGANGNDASGPRKRCISTGTPLSATPSSFLPDEPVPALPNGLSGGVARRNSVLANFGSGRRVMSESDAEGRAGDASSSLASLVPDKPPDAQLPIPESVVEAMLVGVQQPQPSSLEADEVTAIPADTDITQVDTLADPLASKNSPSPLYPASQNVSQSSSAKPNSNDRASDHEASPQSTVFQSSASLPKPTPSTPSSVPSDTSSVAPKSTPVRTNTVVSLSTPTPEKVKKQATVSRDITPTILTSSPPASPSPTFSTPLTTESRQGKPTFKAVVHRKVTDQPAPPAASGDAPSEAPQPTKQRRGTNNINVVEVPPSPGVGDLAVLLEDAAMLELRLTDVGDNTGSKAKEILETTPTSATFLPDLRQMSASTFTEHEPVPSVDSGSLSAGSVSIPSIREPLIDGEIPEEEETDGRSLASTTFSRRSPTSRKYLSNIYRLTGRRSSSYMPGTYPRDSMSVSSEDSSPVTTPSSDGKRKGFGITWPSTSPKKSEPNISRSSSFADKIFNRSRTRSNVSTTDQASERNSLYQSSQPSLTLTFPPELTVKTPPDGVDAGARSTSWISPGDSNSEFSPASSLLDKDIFDAFPSVPQTLPPGFHLDAENTGVGRASTLPVNGRKQVNQRLSMA